MGDNLLNISAAKPLDSKFLSKWKSPERFRRIGNGYGLFFSQSLRSFSVTASLFPSSRFLASALLRSIDFAAARVVVELGFGTGAITNEILRRLRPNSVLLGIDLNPVFVNHVQQKIADARFVPVLGRAERLGSLLNRHGIDRADAIVSSLGLTGMRPSQRSNILAQISEHLTQDGVLTQYQYLHASGEPNWVSSLGLVRFAERDFLRSHFRQVRSERVLWNLPPATVYTCRF
ncbi:MAG TPA: methyltransferase domain-containing protein [Bryobacteraceae bacterium]|nr:methyltransferase domain-containing protein [Bryobacteraceae bacterium]